ncbi:fibronectin type III domain-containing protein 7 isoform X2 [Stigmatopora argus]
MDLTCTISGLKCSTNYTTYVAGSNFKCNSTKSEMITIETAACPPNNVSASLDCEANEALISWDGQPEINSYTATIVDDEDRLLSCSSTATACRVLNLKCGQLYTVTVSHHDSICPSTPSQPIYMESVHCGPQMESHFDCQSQVLTIGWNGSNGANSYIAVLSYNNTQMTHNNTEAELSISSMECGQDYSLIVRSFTDNCVSHPSVITEWKAPCVPTNVAAMSMCGHSYVEVSWQASRGALYYEVAATDKDGHQLLCASNKTSCRLKDLKCSQVYSIAVSAGNEHCFSNESSGVGVQTVAAPCPLSNLTVSIICTSNIAMLSWNSSPNAISYTGKANSTDGHTVFCETIGNVCHLEDLLCGKEYSFTVSATDGDCQSPESDPVIHETAPCIVQNVVSAFNYSTKMLTISWIPGLMPLNYSIRALAEDDTELKCVTETSQCSMANLRRGKQYEMTVTAFSSTCEGPSSLLETISSVPCVPLNVQSAIECSSNTVHTSWDPAAGALFYGSTMTGEGNFTSTCLTSEQSCQFSGLECAKTYVLSVMAQNNQCNSYESTEISVTSA